MEDLKHLEFLAENSKEIIEKQVDSYRQQHSYAGTIIGATALFIPFFLSSLENTTTQIMQFVQFYQLRFLSGRFFYCLVFLETSHLTRLLAFLSIKN